jgi:hypothetical protein
VLDPQARATQNAGGMKNARRQLVLLAILAAGLGSSGCRFLDQLWDRTEGCHDTEIILVNDEQTLGDAFIVGPSEPVTGELRLHSGQSRRTTLCLEIGHSYRFQVFIEGEMVAVARCPASRREYEETKPSVVWTPIGLRCVGW